MNQKNDLSTESVTSFSDCWWACCRWPTWSRRRLTSRSRPALVSDSDKISSRAWTWKKWWLFHLTPKLKSPTDSINRIKLENEKIWWAASLRVNNMQVTKLTKNWNHLAPKTQKNERLLACLFNLLLQIFDGLDIGSQWSSSKCSCGNKEKYGTN